MNIFFLGSAKIVVPILESILKQQGARLKDVCLQQITNLLKDPGFKSKLVHPKSFANLPDGLEYFIQKNQIKALDQKISLSKVITQPDRVLRKKTLTNPVKQFCLENNIQTSTPESLKKDSQDLIQQNKKNMDIAIVAAYGQIIPESFFESFDYGMVNWHPSRLPQYRGATPMQTSILNGDTRTALSWIEIVKAMDAGNILLQISQDILPTHTTTDLAKNMSDLGGRTWAIALSLQIISKTFQKHDSQAKQLVSLAQDPTKATFCQLLAKEDALVCPNKQSAFSIYNHYRAFLEYPKTEFISKYFKQKIKIIKATKPVWDQEFAKISNSKTLSLNLSMHTSPIRENLTKTYMNEWVQVRLAGKELKTFLICQGHTLSFLEVEEICLENGKKINFKGYDFRV